MKNKAKIVRIGGIEEWYAPTYESPVMENDGIIELFDELGLPYVYGPYIRKDERLSEDLGCIAERLCCSHDDDGSEIDVIYAAERCLEDCKPRTVEVGGETIEITPFAEAPKLEDSAFAEFGEYAVLFKERYAAI